MLSSPRQLALALSAQPAASFANFVAGRTAELLAVLRDLARGQGDERFVYLWGAPGSGRGHLLQAVVREASACARCAIHLTAPVEPGAVARIDADTVVALAGVEQLDGDAQAALFGLYNRIRDAAGALVVAGDATPARLPVRPDLATRLAWGLVYEVHALSDDDKAAAMCARATEHGFELSAEAHAYVLRHGRRDLPSLLKLVDLIERHSLEAQRPVTLALVREVLKGVRSAMAPAEAPGKAPARGSGAITGERMRLALFDLDNTLLAGDSDYEWAQFLIEEGVLERGLYETRNREFYEQYKAGVLDIRQFLDFQLKPLAQYPRATLDAWHRGFMAKKIVPIISAQARALIARHRDDLRVIITATNRFVTAPIAAELGIENLVATDPEECDGCFTGGVSGEPCFREGKLVRLESWLAERGLSLDGFSESWFYSDSVNDLPLLERVTHPVAVDPDARLEAHARTRGWPILQLHSTATAR
jgi:DnaA regulatory inactivator Hda